MKHTLQDILVVFQIFGMSIKSFNSNKSISHNCLPIISRIVNLVSFGFSVFFAVIQLLSDYVGRIKFITAFSFSYILVVASLNLFTAYKNQKSEDEFWKIFKSFGKSFSVSSRAVRRRTVLKLLIISLQLMAILIVVPILVFVGYNLTFAAHRVLLGATFIKLFYMKFVFYVEALSSCYEDIENKVRVNSVKEIKSIKESFAKCKKLCEKIEEIFGMAMVFNWANLLNCSALSMHLVFFQVSNGKLALFGIAHCILVFIDVFIIASTCQNCFNTIKKIEGLLFKKNLRELKLCAETFSFQNHHHRIKISPKNMFHFNHIALVSVNS